MNREEWLIKVTDEVRNLFKVNGYPLPKVVRVGVGWPSSRAFGKTRRLGECWHPDNAKDKASNIIISPIEDDSIQVAGTLIHELAHAATPGAGHQGEFVKCIRAIGLLGKPKHAGELDQFLRSRVDKVISAIGKYPHAALDGNIRRKKQSTRMIKLECIACGYIVRTTQKWVDTGIPLCHCCEEAFVVVEPEEGEA